MRHEVNPSKIPMSGSRHADHGTIHLTQKAIWFVAQAVQPAVDPHPPPTNGEPSQPPLASPEVGEANFRQRAAETRPWAAGWGREEAAP